MMNNGKRTLLVTVCVAGLLMGCSVGSDYQRPDFTYADRWQSDATMVSVDAHRDWLDGYGDDALAGLLDRARENNLDIAATGAALERAKALLTASNADLYPSVSTSGSVARAVNNPESGKTAQSSSASGLVSVGYELDLWGNVAAQIDKARDNVAVAEFNHQSAWLSVSSDIAALYTQYRFLDEQKYIQEQILKNTQETEKLAKELNDKGRNAIDTALEAAIQTKNTQSTLDGLNTQIKTVKNALAVLVGVAPQDFTVPKAMKPFKWPDIAAAQPSSLLERRPDIAVAEANLRAANADITIAKAAFYPSVNLSAGAGLAVSGLTDPASQSLSLAASVAQKIFSGGELEANLTAATARQEELVADYKQTILTAFQDAQDALVTLENTGTDYNLAQAIEEQQKIIMETDKQRFESGRTAKGAFLSSLNSYLRARSSLLDAKITKGKAMLTLYKAFGRAGKE